MTKAQAEPSMEEILASIRRIISEDEDTVVADTVAAAVENTPVAKDIKPVESAPAPPASEPPPVQQVTPAPAATPKAAPASVAKNNPTAAARTAKDTKATTSNPQSVPGGAHRDPQPSDQQTSSVQSPSVSQSPNTPKEQTAVGETKAAKSAAEKAPVVKLDVDRPASAPGKSEDKTSTNENLKEESDMISDSSAQAAAKAFDSLSEAVRISSAQEGRTLEDIVTEMLRPMIKDWLDGNLPAIVEEKVEAEVQRLSRRRR
ncbi:MAG: DUF2497 domain-containing protein [Pseudomonadota bacterium]